MALFATETLQRKILGAVQALAGSLGSPEAAGDQVVEVVEYRNDQGEPVEVVERTYSDDATVDPQTHEVTSGTVVRTVRTVYRSESIQEVS